MVSELQFKNGEVLMLVTEAGIVMLVNEVQPSNAAWSMIVTEAGSEIDVSALQFANTELPMPTVSERKVTVVTLISQPTTHLST